MEQPPLAPYPISDFLQWEGAKQLVLTPKFQRRDVWSVKAKSFLIDSILRKMPIPAIFLRLKTETSPPKTSREVVDGQQRLRCVLSYVADEFQILSTHNREYGGLTFSQLPDDAKEDLLGYKFHVHTLENITDAEVLRIFARLNTYTEKLKPQELLNAEFFGIFKQSIYDISLNHHAFWVEKKIFTDARIARMAEAEFVSELMISMMDGIRQTKHTQIKSYYSRYDDEFADQEKYEERFRSIIDDIGNAYGDNLPKSPFRRLPIFYSLFLAIYDYRYGLPTIEEGGEITRNERARPRRINHNQLQDRLKEIQQAMASDDPGDAVEQFMDDSSRGTADPARRRSRHRFLMEKLFGEH